MSDTFGHVTQHMALHIVTMNIVAPAVAWLLRGVSFRHLDRLGVGLGVAACVQLGLLWLMHVPGVFALMGVSSIVAAPMHAALFVIAFVFWRQVFAVAATSPWRSIVALLITGKIVCLLGVLLLFATRPLYTVNHGGMVMQSTLGDQQVAGLLMLIGCPLAYIFGATLIASNWLLRMDRSPAVEKPGAT